MAKRDMSDLAQKLTRDPHDASRAAKSKSRKVSAPAEKVSTESQKAESGESDASEGTSKRGKKYLRLDVDKYHDYLKIMARYSGVSVTKYIQQLIDADKEKNVKRYEELKKFYEEFEKKLAAVE